MARGKGSRPVRDRKFTDPKLSAYIKARKAACRGTPKARLFPYCKQYVSRTIIKAREKMRVRCANSSPVETFNFASLKRSGITHLRDYKDEQIALLSGHVEAKNVARYRSGRPSDIRNMEKRLRLP